MKKEELEIIKGVKAGYTGTVYGKVKFKGKYKPKKPIIVQKRFLDSILRYKDLQTDFLEIGIAENPESNVSLLSIREYPAKNKDVWYAIVEYRR